MYIWIELKYIEEDYINLHYYIQFKGRGRDWWGGGLSDAPYSCRNPVIPADSSAIPVEFTSQNFIPATEFWYSGNFTGTVPGIDRNEMALESSDRKEH